MVVTERTPQIAWISKSSPRHRRPPEHNGRREGEPAGAVSRLLVQKSRGLIRPAVKWRNLPAADYRWDLPFASISDLARLTAVSTWTRQAAASLIVSNVRSSSGIPFWSSTWNPYVTFRSPSRAIGSTLLTLPAIWGAPNSECDQLICLEF